MIHCFIDSLLINSLIHWFFQGEATTAKTVSADKLAAAEAHLDALKAKAKDGTITIGDAVNLAIIEEMLRDPSCVIHAEDLQAGSSYDIPKMTQQTFGRLRAADEIIDEGHFMGKGESGRQAGDEIGI